MAEDPIQIVLAGNPNCGKSTIFNHLTGARQHVGNYPGVTVERVEGHCTFQNRKIDVIDLPGTYSLLAHSEDEAVAPKFLLEPDADDVPGRKRVLVNVVDASNFERNLFLTLQLRELGEPMVLVLNMLDLAHHHGMVFHNDEISARLNVPVVECVGATGEGLDDLLSAVVLAAQSEPTPIPEALRRASDDGLCAATVTTETELDFASRRYAFITEIIPSMLSFEEGKSAYQISPLDKLFLNRFLGIPIFFLMMYLVFQLTFTLGAFPMTWIESGISALAEFLNGFWPAGSESLLRSLLVDGVLGGVGGVLVFLPNIVFLFLAISFLEDSGYMARAAVLMDRFMTKIGLHGKSFIPMLIGFGCTVPAVMATRILEDRRERLTTMLVVPLMSCGARFPIYALLIPAFFPSVWQGPMLFFMYILGIVLAVFLVKILSFTILRGEPVPFVMELPPYHVPTLQTVGIHTLERAWMYVKKAGTVILGISILLWALTTFPRLPQEKIAANATPEEVAQQTVEYSGIGRLGTALNPVWRPMGFDWKVGTSFLGAFAAKEIFVAQLGIVYKVSDSESDEVPLQKILQEKYTALQGFCILLFALIATPCCATVAMTAQESGSWKWAALQWGGLTLLGWTLTTLVYQIGTRFF